MGEFFQGNLKVKLIITSRPIFSTQAVPLKPHTGHVELSRNLTMPPTMHHKYSEK